jgi:hypothetical protein
VKQRLVSVAPYAAVALIGGAAVLLRLLTQFNPVDDEGYSLISLSQFLAGGDLYDQVFTQYGPFYHEVYGALFSIPGVDLTHETGRVIVALLWVAIATGYGVLAERLTNSRLLGVGAQVVSFAILYQVVREPTHPIGLTTALVLAIIAGVALWKPSVSWTAVSLGVLVAALTLVKINMGVPAGVALLVAALIVFSDRRHRLAIVAGSGALMAVMVIAIASSKIDVGWVRMLLVLELAGLAAILIRVVALAATNDHVALMAWIGTFLAGAIGTAIVVCGVIIALGTSPAGLVDGVIVSPSRHPADTSSTLMLRWWTVPLAVALVAAAYCSTLPGFAKRLSVEARAYLRLAAAAAIWLSISAPAPGGLDPGTTRLVAGVLLAWLAIAPPAELGAEGRKLSFARLAIVLVAVLEVMQAYPIGFSRVESAGVSFVVVGAIIAGDGLRLLAFAGDRATQKRKPAIAALGLAIPAALVAMIAIAGVLQPLVASARDYKQGRSVELPGMGMLHLPDATATAYEQLAGATRGCDPLVVLPSFYSLYPWAGLQPPTGQNANAWPLLLETEEQQEVADAIAGKPDLCLLLNQQAESVLISSSEAGRVPDRPLYRFLSETRFEPALSIDVNETGGQFTLLRRTADPRRGTVGGGLDPIN